MKKFMIFIISLILFIPSVKADTHRYQGTSGDKSVYVGDTGLIIYHFEFFFDNEPSSSNNYNTVFFDSHVSNPTVLKLQRNSERESFSKGFHNYRYYVEFTGLKAGKSEICVTEAPCFEINVKERPTTTTTTTTKTTTTKKTTTTTTKTTTTKKNSPTTTKIKTTSTGATSKRGTTTTIKSSNSITTSSTTTTIKTQETTLPIIEEPTTEVITEDILKETPKLNNLIIKNHQIDFSPNIFEYTIDVKDNEKTLDIETQCKENYNCTNGILSIEDKNEIIVSAIDNNGVQTDYKIVIKREKEHQLSLLLVFFFAIILISSVCAIFYKKTKNKKEEIEVITLDEIR